MSRQPVVLALVNGLGLGNATRNHAVLQALARLAPQVAVHVLTSGNGLWYFSDRLPADRLHALDPLRYVPGPDGQISIWRTLLAAPEHISVMRRNARTLDTLLSAVQPDLALIDSIYTVGPLKRRGIPVVALNNADAVHVAYRRHLSERPSAIRAQFHLIEEPDFRFHRRTPMRVFSPCIDPSLPEVGPPFQRVGPVVRDGYATPTPPDQRGHVLVMLSGSGFATPVDIPALGLPVHVVGRSAPAGPGRADVTYHGKVSDTLPLLRGARVAVVNGGFSAISEVVSMRVPAVVLPVRNHAEQWLNARTLAGLGIGRIGAEATLAADIAAVLRDVAAHQQAFEALAAAPDGAARIASGIVECLG